ncbi:hypothetical protein D3C75_631210 [compost metagenome]
MLLLGVEAFSLSAENFIKSSRSTRVMSASFMRGSDLPKASMIISLLPGEARLDVTSTNNLPPAVRIGAGVVNR